MNINQEIVDWFNRKHSQTKIWSFHKDYWKVFSNLEKGVSKE